MVDERSISHDDFSLCFLTHHKPKERAGSKMSYYDRALELKDELIENRRYLHSHAEAGLTLPNTVAYVESCGNTESNLSAAARE
mgnify:CR=1 FL=1